MVRWFWQRSRAPERTLRVRSRGDHGDVSRVDFEELAPDIDTFLGQAAYLQLGYFETLSELIAPTPDLTHKERLSLAAGSALTKHRALVGLIRERGEDSVELMLPFREPLDAFRRATHGARPLETMLSVHITAGMLDDFYRSLSASYGSTGSRVAAILDRGEVFVEYPPQTRIEGELQRKAPDFPIVELWEVFAGRRPGRLLTSHR